MTLNEQMIADYIHSKRRAWAPSTLRTEEARLESWFSEIDVNDPDSLWDAMESRGIKPYSRLTIWTRVTDFVQFLIDTGQLKGASNKFYSWRKHNKRLFKNVYETKKPEVSFEDAKAKVESIEDPALREKALQLIQGGLRYTESFTLEGGRVIGKGQKVRDVFVGACTERGAVHYHNLRRELAKFGLKPHDLRKIFLSKLAQEGFNPFELCEVAGWTSVETAMSYIKVNSDALRMKVSKVQGGTSVDPSSTEARTRNPKV